MYGLKMKVKGGIHVNYLYPYIDNIIYRLVPLIVALDIEKA